MYDFGMKLGIAFQIHDDWLDIWGAQSATGKGVGADLQGKKWTLPLLRYRELASHQDMSKMQDLLDATTVDVDAIRALLEEVGADDYTRQLAKSFIDQAMESLEHIQGSEEHAALVKLALAAIHRTR